MRVALVIERFEPGGGGSHAEYMERQYRGSGVGGFALSWPTLSPRHRVLLAIERREFADASPMIQCNSRMVQLELMRRYAIPDERLVPLYNRIDLERFHPSRRATDAARLRAELGAGETPVRLFVGSGFRRKGLGTALRALHTRIARR